jgi:alanine racemase
MSSRSQNSRAVSRRRILQMGGMFFPAALTSAACDRIDKREIRQFDEGTPAMDGSIYEPWIELNYDNLGYNLDQIRGLSLVPVMAVVKAEAYGHGLINTAKYLESRVTAALMVGKKSEALRLREAGIRTPVLNFGPFGAEDAEILVEHDISQSVFTPEASFLGEAAERMGKRAGVHIHIDTGMGRAGVPFRSAFPYIEEIYRRKGLRIEGISTTLTEDPEFDRIQLKRFLSLCSKAGKAGIDLGIRHAASSGGLMTLTDAYLNMVRPGIALYGYYPSDETQAEDRLGLKPVLSLKSRIHTVKTLSPGDSVSYHRAYKARRKERIALITMGYSDGYPPQATDKAFVLIGGRRCPVIGGLTSNHTLSLLDDDMRVSAGDEVVFIGTQGQERISAFQVAAWAGISVYKVLIGMNPLLPKKESGNHLP